MKKYLTAMVLVILMSCEPVYATTLVCLQEDDQTICKEEQNTKSLALTVARILVVEVGKSVAVKVLTELIVQEYYKKFGEKIKATQITILK